MHHSTYHDNVKTKGKTGNEKCTIMIIVHKGQDKDEKNSKNNNNSEPWFTETHAKTSPTLKLLWLMMSCACTCIWLTNDLMFMNVQYFLHTSTFDLHMTKGLVDCGLVWDPREIPG